MTADEREAEIVWLSGFISFWLEIAMDDGYAAAAREGAREKAREYADRQRDLIAQRTPAEVEQMERERGLR